MLNNNLFGLLYFSVKLLYIKAPSIKSYLIFFVRNLNVCTKTTCANSIANIHQLCSRNSHLKKKNCSKVPIHILRIQEVKKARGHIYILYICLMFK